MVTRLSGGLTPADGADPRTFPAIWNVTAVDIETAQSEIDSLQLSVNANGTAITALQGSAVALGSAVTVLQGSAVALGSAVDAIEAWDLNDLNDVTIGTAVSQDQVLAYSTAVSGWVNADAAGGKILQVVSTNKTDLFTTTRTSFVDVTGFSATITPASSASKILVLVTTQIRNDSATGFWALNLVRASTNIAQGTGGSVNQQTAWSAGNISLSMSNLGITVLDSPATSSATTYKVQVNRAVAGNTEVGGNSSSSAFSSITLIEVAD
jgi:hypothetical protein